MPAPVRNDSTLTTPPQSQASPGSFQGRPVEPIRIENPDLSHLQRDIDQRQAELNKINTKSENRKRICLMIAASILALATFVFLVGSPFFIPMLAPVIGGAAAVSLILLGPMATGGLAFVCGSIAGISDKKLTKAKRNLKVAQDLKTKHEKALESLNTNQDFQNFLHNRLKVREISFEYLINALRAYEQQEREIKYLRNLAGGTHASPSTK